MKLTNIEIKNFRGIKHASVFFPLDSRIICLIGSGDSGKSTLLTAIEWALWPSWSLIATGAGYLFGNIPFVSAHFSVIILGIALITLLPTIIGIIRSVVISQRAKKITKSKK